MSDNEDGGTEMTDNPHTQVLSWVVDRYDRQDEPVSLTAAAAHFGQDTETIRSCFECLDSNHLLTTEGVGYRPTVTARELLELDVDDESLFVLDADSIT